MNKYKKKLSKLFIALSIILCGILCVPSAVKTVEAKVRLNKSSITLTKGKSKTLKIKGTKKKVKWTSKNTKIAKVNKKGKVTAKKKGTTKIVAKIGKKKYICKVTVINPKTNKPVTGTPNPGSPSPGAESPVPQTPTPESPVPQTPTLTETPIPQTPTLTETPISQTPTPTPEIPPDATATKLEFNTKGGGDFICGISLSEVQFELDADTSDVKVQILNELDDVIYSKEFSSCKRGSTYQVEWDGKTKDGNYIGDAACYVKIIAGTRETVSDYLTVIAMESNDFGGGNGSKTNPYQVVTLDHLRKVSLHNKCYFIQSANIDANYENFTAMFRSDNAFAGVYDGNGKMISNLLIKNTSDSYGTALFHSIGETGILKNLTLSNCTSNLSINATTNGFGACLAVENAGTIQGCTLQNCNVVVNAPRDADAGMISMKQTVTGVVTDCNVQNCSITASGRSSYLGGISSFNEGKIIRATVEGLRGKVTGDGYWGGITIIGGIVARNENGANIITTKVSDTSLESSGGNSNYCGGIAGENNGTILSWSWNSADGSLSGSQTGDCCAINNGITNP